MTPSPPEVPESSAEALQEPTLEENAQEAQQCSRSERKQVLLQKFISIMETASPQSKMRCKIILAEAVAFVSDPTNASASAAELCDAIRKKLREVNGR
ncbi:hypothetical protein CAEBREN_14383 [Caenorhabditis brenneri]|uniref:Uncharacterized protein n=1 Tax=Caenorhabditis brenneri TaxID=135651 RepID=G0PAV0_CAEBE|nr:hypothetical protein CAEBREN_14383 [Caenorhabditis brenneri]